MLRVEGHKSEVARLLSQISAEYEAITARMENMGQLHTELQSIVGDSAIALIADALNKLS